jgi:hypothetical protein
MPSTEGLADCAVEDGHVVQCLPRVSDLAVRDLALQIERRGFAVLPDYLGPDALEKLQGFVRRRVSEAGGEYIALNGKDEVSDTFLGELPDRPEFVSLSRRLYEQATAEAAPRQAIHQVLRCLAGRTAQRESYIFHFDSYVITLLLPILIPEKGRRGHLIMSPNLRNIRRWYVLNLVDKLLIDNKLTQFLLKQLFRLGVLKLSKVEMIPGNLYMFWGYRTLHTNEPCDPENIRSTALFHFGDPHSDSYLRRSLGRVAV